MFRFKRSIPVGYDLQGYIYFLSKRYDRLPWEQQHLVAQLCVEAGGEHHQALFAFVTTDMGAVAVCGRYHLSQSTLERVVRRYYVNFAERLR